MKESIVDCRGVRFSVEREGEEVGHAYLYLPMNDLHTEPFGLLEDVYVDERYRGQGIAGELVTAVMERARDEPVTNCLLQAEMTVRGMKCMRGTSVSVSMSMAPSSGSIFDPKGT